MSDSFKKKPVIVFSMLITLTAVSFSCAKRLNSTFNKSGCIKKTEVPKSVFKEGNYDLKFSRNIGDSIQITYLGCGGFSITRNQKTVLIDPFFTNPNFVLKSTGAIKMRTKTAMVDLGMSKIPKLASNKIEAILVSHSHYDHLMDIPYVYRKYASKDLPQIYCSQSSKNMINGVGAITNDKVTTLNHKTSTIDKVGKRFYNANSTIRITPIKTEHAPHWHGIKMYSGDARQRRKYNDELSRSRAGWWKEGETYAFLIDFMNTKDSDSIEFRLYIQSSSANMPNGWLPDDIKAEASVDLAILGIASFQYVDHYPESLIDHLQPEKLVLCHWEDFFREYDNPKIKTVRATNIKKAIQRVEKVYPYDNSLQNKMTLPHTGVTLTIKR